MNGKKTMTRNEMQADFKWDIEAMYPDEKDWERDFLEVIKLSEQYEIYSGKLAVDSKYLLEGFKAKDKIWQLLEKIYVYSRMRRDEDNRLDKYQTMNDRCSSLVAKASTAMSFFTPELLSIPEEKIVDFIKNEKGLEVYQFTIDNMLREKAHILSYEEENIISQYSEITGATNDIFTMLNNADIKFGTIIDEDGDEVELTHGKYIGFMESSNRELRKKAFEMMYDAYIKQINTIATAYNYNTKTDVIISRIRRYPSSLDAALSGDNISHGVYENLIETVNKNLGLIYRYMNIRKKILKLDELHMYDIYVPLFNAPDKNLSYEDALLLMKDGMSVLGPEYLKRVEAGIKDRWIDVYENEGKTSGAYSFGSYDSMPYVLLNYNNKYKDVFTLTHEMGHSIHSKFTREEQPFIYGGHSIFTAEVASTVNESLLMKHLLTTETDKETKKYILTLYIEEFRSTLFRQTMFAEFEMLTHKAVENGEALTADWLCREYKKLVAKYFGPDVILDKEIEYEWSRIPHFYNAFYVYKYATG
ncbi:MAG: oligoendopeptidase F, partial [Peptostreptococcaceae bacterium]|nr:oligoendopeptidase F [Peptostreptococcaceae bacterium]